MFSIHERSARHQLECIILGNTKRCPHCQTKLKPAKDYWWCKGCRVKVRIKAWLRGSKLSYKQILVLLHAWQRDVSIKSVKELCELSYPTIARWYRRFSNHLPREDTKLTGSIIEVDESFFGRARYNNQQIVMGLIDRQSRQIRLEVIADREQDSLETVLLRYIPQDKEVTVSTDGWSSYTDLGFYGWDHWQDNHSIGCYSETNQIENVWSVMKRRIRRVYGVIRIKYLRMFMREMEARCNFPQLFENCISYLQVCLFRVS